MHPLLIPLFCQAALQHMSKAFQARDRCFEFVARHADELVFATFDHHPLRDIVDDGDNHCYLPALIHHRT